jgi:polyphosphate kinase
VVLGRVLEAGADPPPTLKRKQYEREMRRLYGELVAMQERVKASGAKICIVFEGRDTAGKGGTSKRIIERVSPRVFRVAVLPAPTEREKSQMYLQRYVPHSPAAGEVVIFDRSFRRLRRHWPRGTATGGLAPRSRGSAAAWAA